MDPHSDLHTHKDPFGSYYLLAGDPLELPQEGPVSSLHAFYRQTANTMICFQSAFSGWVDLVELVMFKVVLKSKMCAHP